MSKKTEVLDEVNAEVMAEMISDPDTSDQQRVKMINKLLEARASDTFFQTMFTEDLSYGECPHCEHKNHWLVPEDELNQMGYVTHKTDERVRRNTTIGDCDRWQESCAKKKVTI